MISNDRSASGAIEDHGPVVHELIAEGARDRAGTWNVDLFADVMRVSNDDALFFYSRAEIVEKARITLVRGAGALVLDGSGPRLQLGAEATRTLCLWMGPSLPEWGKKIAAHAALQTFTAGLFLLVLWWFIDGWMMLALGVPSLITGAGRYFAPGRWAFAADAAKSLFVAALLVVDILFGGLAWWWTFLVVLLLFGSHALIQQFRFFAPDPKYE